MPFSTTTLVRLTAKLSRCLSLALLPALASEAHALVGQPQRKPNMRAAQSGAVTAEKRGTLPYLAALGPLPLRFARPGPEPTDEPPAPPQPKPAVAVKTPDDDAQNSEKAKAPTEEKPAATIPAPDDAQPEHAPESSEFSEPTRQPPLPILPDDTKRELRAEDVIPFFIYPSPAPSNRDVGVQVIVPLNNTDQPQSNPLPPSSATYQQK